MSKNRYYSPEFKDEAVRLALEEKRRIRDVERSLGITQGLLNGRVQVQRLRDGDATSLGGQSTDFCATA